MVEAEFRVGSSWKGGQSPGIPAGVGNRHSNQSYLDLKGRLMPGLLDKDPKSQVLRSYLKQNLCHRREKYEKGRRKYVRRERPMKEKGGLVVNRLRGSSLGKK